MTRDDIIRMAREADLLVTTPIPDDSVFVADLERFAHLPGYRVAVRGVAHHGDADGR